MENKKEIKFYPLTNDLDVYILIIRKVNVLLTNNKRRREMKTKIVVYKNKKGKEYKGIYVNEDHKGYLILPEGKTHKKHIKFAQVVCVREE